jgi:hypothetical protein
LILLHPSLTNPPLMLQKVAFVLIILYVYCSEIDLRMLMIRGV